jgi:predicted phage terminase large subunit-like protein
MDFTSSVKAIRSMSAKHPQARKKLIEDKANGPAVITTLKKELSGIVAVEPKGSKEARASAISPYFEAGNVYIPDPSIHSWVHDYIEEMVSFPKAAHDDQVDMTSQALLEMTNSLNTSLEKLVTWK